MAKLLAVFGDYYHPIEWAKESLEKAIQAYSLVDIELEYCTYESLEESIAQNPVGVILFKENRLNPLDKDLEHWMTEELASKISNYVERGGGWLAWHSGLASYNVGHAYIKMLKGYFLYHPEKHQLVHYESSSSDFIFQEQVSFEIVDEHYFVNCDKSQTNVFLTSQSIDGEGPAGWAHRFGNGKVCCLTPAHNKEGLLNQDFLHVLASSIAWIISNN